MNSGKDRKRKTLRTLAIALCALVLSLPAAYAANNAAPAPGEYVILSGGPSLMIWEKWKMPPHDLWWQNFVRAGEIRISQLEAGGVAPKDIAWLVYQPSFQTRAQQDKKDYLGDISARAHALGVRLTFFRSAQEVYHYINAGQPRDRVKIVDFEYFGHSNKACWMFDYSNQIDSASKVWLHEDELSQISPNAFARTAFIKSWGCHTGESMSQKFRKQTGAKMWGAIGRTQYNTDELPSLADHSGKWKY